MLIDIKIKKSVAVLGCLKVYVDPKKCKSTLAFKSISPKRLSIFG